MKDVAIRTHSATAQPVDQQFPIDLNTWDEIDFGLISFFEHLIKSFGLCGSSRKSV